MSSPTITRPVFEQHHSGLGVDCSQPRISWQFEADEGTAPGWTQTGYEVEVTFCSSSNDAHTYSITSDQSVLVPWPARPLQSRESATIRIRASGHSVTSDAITRDIDFSPWSPAATVEAALLEPSDLTADFITSSQDFEPRGPLRPIRFRKTFSLPAVCSQHFRHARLYITALGVYEAYINGERVGDEYMAPGWTTYKHRIAYRVHDVSELLRPSEENVLAIQAAEGWYAGRLGFRGGQRFRYGDKIGILAQLEVTGSESERWTLTTDHTWQCGPSPLVTSEIYDGEVFDSREEDDQWNTCGRSPSRSDKLNIPVTVLPKPAAKLFSPDMAPVRVTEVKPCIDVFQSASGKIILDFGQNLVGVLRVKSLAPGTGAEVCFTHAEVMEHGELGIRPLKLAKCRDIVIGSGHELGPWSPKFTFHGFRYVQLDGWPDAGPPDAANFEALVLHTDMTRRGFFECSNGSVNQLHRNVVWSMRGNFLSLPTDCPQRDERLGWTGDAQVFAPTASFLYDSTPILNNWLEDVAAEQFEEGQNGVPPVVVPFALGPNFARNMPQAIWDDVTVLMPHDLYRYSGDQAVLERQFRSMQAWLDEGVARAPDGLWDPNVWQFADWLDPSAPPEDPANGRTDPSLVANAYLVHTTRVFARVCRLLNKSELAEKHEADADRLLQLFQTRYITPEGHLMSSTQTALSLAISFDLFPSSLSMRKTASAALDRLVRTARFTIATGFAGTPVIAGALTAAGMPQLAYRMLLETQCPSWLYPITMGATTVWERWNSMMPDGTINPGHMTSFNHYALGAVADWLHSSVGGISPAEAGWKVIRVRPIPGGNIASAKVRFHGPYGLVACEWEWKDGSAFSMKVTVPPNSTAVVTLPCDVKPSFLRTAHEGKGRLVNGVDQENCQTVGSGVHVFTCDFVAGEWPPKPWTPPFLPPPPATIAE
ncbi:alfa-L-rhamnosidase [Microdochium trichocladiopsis]|uniref:alpha-L-rhamnosidase n=1 Tax=Microdochium trichocladiopsis TaxID=1682393 RepID=A0A9P8XRU0_9PEZI|nr:alfa-L-rhamnosidase [Microdochium trichocladiopsis]KAH7014096.1 alfa-L-rhamnosidase [Microdochium trichocladiopsis]